MHGLGSGGRLRHLCRSVRGIALFLTSSSYSLPPPAASSSILARFFSTSSMDGVAMAIYCGFVVRGDIVFLRMVYSERIVSGPATASVCLESGGLDSDNLPGIMYTIPS